MQNASSSNNIQRHLEQFPVDIRIVRGVRFRTDYGDILRIVVMSGHTALRYSPYREYHYGTSAVSVDCVSRINMQCEKLEPSEHAIGQFVKGMSAPLVIPQVVRFNRGIEAPSGAKSRLFKATDPDDETKMMGLMIEQDKLGNLERVTWYKAWEASAAFRVAPENLGFQLVTDETGAPSSDPNQIGGWTWYFSTNCGIDVPAPSITV